MVEAARDARTDQHSNRVSTNTGLRRRETRFCEAETKAPKGPRKSNRQIVETNGCTMPAGSGLFLTELGNLCLVKTAWWGWEDSNFQPNDYQSLALSSLWRFPG